MSIPKPGKGQITYEWHYLDEPIICHLDYQKAQRGLRERGSGMQLEPDYPSQTNLCAAYLRDVDILLLLSKEQIAHIEQAALKQYEWTL